MGNYDSQLWRTEYEQSWYLRHLPDGALDQRISELQNNLWATDESGRAVRLADGQRRARLWQLLVHATLEKKERESTATVNFDEGRLIASASASYIAPVLKAPMSAFPAMSKFAKREHIIDALGRGRLRIAPASSYDDPSLNSAQADKELEHFTRTPNERMRFTLFMEDEHGNDVEAPVKPLELFRYMHAQDFFVWCCGTGYDARLFHDFQVSAALLVHDAEQFKLRVAKAVEAVAVLPRMQMIHGPLRYYDAYTEDCTQLTPIFSKNLKYLYQNEYRFAWTPADQPQLSAFFVELGPLHDICEMVETG